MTDPRLDSVLLAALGRIQAAVSSVVDKVGGQLGPLALAASSNAQRQVLMTAQLDLQRKTSALSKTFSNELRERVDKAAHRQVSSGGLSNLTDTDWASLSLVDNAEVERSVSADKLALALAQECDKALDDLNAHLATLLNDPSPERNPLRPQTVAKALLKALADVSEEQDVCLALSHHIGRVLGPALKDCYQQIVQDLRAQGVQPMGLSVQKSRVAQGGGGGGNGQAGGPGTGAVGPTTSPGSLHGSVNGGLGATSQNGPWRDTYPGQSMPLSSQAHLRAAHALSEMFGVSMPGAPLDGPTPVGLRHFQPGPGCTANAAHGDFHNLLRRLTQQGPSMGGSTSILGTMHGDLPSLDHQAEAGFDGHGLTGASGFAGPLMAANLIRAHRDELVRASGGAALDQMVIDIVAALFDQVLSDPKVAPQMARQIARLQMPVLRVALADMTFFNSRKHPVRRFVNRIASLSASFEDYGTGPGLACLERITALVNDIVDGDFDRMDLYASKLAELEAFIETENERDAAEHAAVAALLNGKEADLRVQQRYMQILKRELADVEMPEFVRDFLAQIWSQVQVMASARDGVQSPFAQRMKKTGHELALSVQPKGHPQLRKDFLLKLPQLMKDLNEGLGLIQWSDDAKRDFFSQLLPSHAESLKTAPPHDLTTRLLEQRLSQVEQIAIPSREEAANDPLPASLDNIKEPPVLTVVSALTPDEVQQAAFMPEASLASGPLDIDLDAPDAADPSLVDVDINLDAPPTPSAGVQLMHHLHKGTAYQMLMQGQWKKVRLTWVSDGRSFFIFTHGHMHKQTVSLTARTLAKMCDSGRFKAFEQAELLERATVRARRQLAALASAPRKSAA